MIEDCCYILAILIEMVKLFGIYFAFATIWLLIYYGTLYYELLLTVGIKEKERKVCGKISIIICLGSIIQKFWLGENVKLPLFVYPFFPPILLIILDSLTPKLKSFDFPLYPLVLRLFIG